MLRCAWCMKKISNNKPVFGLSVKFVEGLDYTESEGKIIQIGLRTRNTSVPLIITARESEAKLQGTDGIFALCSKNCGKKMKDTLTKEIEIFKEFKDIALQ
ncbi:hypothetical protein E2R56_26540 [Rhodococcus qingshengii]|nr:hypothetical protein E2R56_26540 [Rhodococcus qingshengii]